MAEQFQDKIDDILLALNIIKDNAATKEDLKAFATKKDLKAMELSICDKIGVQIAQLQGENVALMRKEDHKTLEIIEITKEKRMFDKNDYTRVAKLEPFPQLML